MKKTYITPAVNMMRVLPHPLMTGSATGGKVYNEEDANEEEHGLSRRRRDIWYDEEEEEDEASR